MRARPRHRELRRRLYLAAIAAVAAVPILLFAATLAHDSVVDERMALEESLWRGSREALAAVDATLANHVAALEALSVFIDPDGGNLVGLYTGVAARLRDQYGWKNVRLIDARTYEVIAGVSATGEDPPTIRVPAAIDAVVRTGWPAATVLPRDLTGPGPDVVLRVPIRHDERIDQVLAASIDSAIFSQLLLASAIPPVWTAAAIDPAFHIAGRNRAREEFVGTPITDSLRSEIEGAAENFFFALNKEGERVYTLFTRSPSSGWTIAIGAPAAVVERPLFWSNASLAGAGGGAVVLAGLLALFMVRNFERRQEAEERLAAVAAEAETERRLTEIARNFPGVIYRRVLHPDGRLSYPFVSDGIGRLLGATVTELRKPSTFAELAEAIRYEPGVDWEGALVASARDLTPYKLEGALRTPDGGTRWVRSLAVPHRQPDGSVAWDGVALDVTEERRADEERRLLMAELDHRVRNTLAVVQALALSTLPRDGAAEVFAGRLRALAHAHGLLAETRWTGASLAKLAEAELAPYRENRDGARVTLTGAEVSLAPAVAQTRALVLHALATNAAKHGALSTPTGRVAMTWGLDHHDDAPDGGDALRLVWSEAGGPTVAPPTREGFGRRLIERSIGYRLSGRTEFEFRPEGLRCEIVFPLEPRPDEAR